MSEIAGEAGAPVKRPPYVDWQRGTTGPDSSSAVPLRPQSLAVFRILHDNAGKAVTKEQLLSTVWPNVAVTDDSLVQCITEIRKAIGDTQRKIIRTLPKRGYIYEPPLAAIPASIQSALPKQNRKILWGGGAGLIAAAMIATEIWWTRPSANAVELPAIAVLPFSNLGTDSKGDKFADMMTEDVITDLSHSRDLAVIARNSTDIYKGKPVDVRAIGQNLKVKYVLEGSVEALPGRVRATAQLIDATTAQHIWSERFEGQGDDIFAVEGDVTTRIATSISAHDAAAASNERSLIRRKPPSQWSAYEYYQAGLEAGHKMSGESIPKAEEMYNKSLEIDPNFARAHLGLAWANFQKLLFGGAPPEQALAKMLQEATIAASLDPQDGETHAALASAYSLMHDDSKMDIETDRALILAPNNADILLLTSYFLVQQGKADEAVANINRALSLNPAYPFWYTTTLYAALFYAGDFQRSYDFAKEAFKAAPVNNDFIAMDAAYLGKTAEAEEARKGLMAIDPEWSAERLLTNFGNFRGEQEVERLVNGAKKAGLRLCMPKEEVAAKPQAIHIKECDEERAKG